MVKIVKGHCMFLLSAVSYNLLIGMIFSHDLSLTINYRTFSIGLHVTMTNTSMLTQYAPRDSQESFSSESGFLLGLCSICQKCDSG